MTSPPEFSAKEIEHRRNKYERKGWSASKIERALQSADGAHVKVEMTEDRERLRDAIATLVGRHASVRLFAHNYSGSQDNEPVTSADKQRMYMTTFAEKAELPPDVIVEVVR